MDAMLLASSPIMQSNIFTVFYKNFFTVENFFIVENFFTAENVFNIWYLNC